MTAILLNDLTFAYEGSDENVFERVTLSLDCRWRLGLIGRNGRGKRRYCDCWRGLWIPAAL